MTNYHQIASEVFHIIAPGLTPSEADAHQIGLLACELWHQDTARKGYTITKTLDDSMSTCCHTPGGVEYIEVKDYFGRPIAECWIEDNSTPNAFFYWEG